VSETDPGPSRAVRSIGLVLALGLVGLLIWGVQAAPSSTSPSSRFTFQVHLVPARIVVYPGVAALDPAPSSAKPSLTFTQAFARYAETNGVRHLTHPLVRGTVYLGLLSEGNGRHDRVRRRLAYAFVSRRTCIQHLRPGVSPPPPHPCEVWTFLDAGTGSSYGQLQVPVPGS
jgi:hypothetical protein